MHIRKKSHDKNILFIKGPVCTFRGRSLFQNFYLPSEKEYALKGKNLLPLGSKFFLFRVDPFQMGLGVQESKQEVTKFVSLVETDRKITKYNYSFYI